MKLIAIISILATAATAQQSTPPEPSLTGDLAHIRSATITPPPSLPWVQLYEVPLDWNGCTVSLHMAGVKRQCFMSLRDILTVRQNPESLQMEVPFAGDVPAALMSDDAASWMYYVMRMMYPTIGQDERKQP